MSWSSSSGAIRRPARSERSGNGVRLLFLAVLIVSGSIAAAGLRPAGGAASADWPQHGFELSNHAYNFREQMARASTASTLQTRWTFTVNEMVPTTPAVVDGIVYFGTWEGIFYAVDA